MSPQGNVVIGALAAVLLLVMLNMLRKRKISEEVSLIWIVAFASVIVLVALPGLTARLTHLVGAIYPASVLTLLALAFIGVMLVYSSVKISRLSQEVRALAQRQVIVEAENLALRARLEAEGNTRPEGEPSR